MDRSLINQVIGDSAHSISFRKFDHVSLSPSHGKQAIPHPLLLDLRIFEASIVARFLTAQEKLLVMTRVNKAWHNLVQKLYSWA